MANGWQTFKIGELVTQNNNGVTVAPDKNYKLLGVRLEGRGAFLREEKTGDNISAKTLNPVRAGDFIYSRLFAWRGAFDVVPDEMNGCFVSDEFPTFSINTEQLFPKFLQHFFARPLIWQEVEKYCTGTTKASRNRFKENFFLDMEIPLPPLMEQRRIVARIEALAGRVAEAQSLRREASEEAEALIKSERNRIFSTMDLKEYGKPLGEVAQFLDGKRIPLNSSQRAEKQPGDIPYYGASGIVDYINEWIFDDTLLLVSEDGANIELRSKPIAFIITGKSWVNNHSHVLKLKDDVTAYFLVHFIENLDVRSMFRGATRPKINKSTLENLIVPNIPLEEQRRLVAYLDGLQAQVSALRAAQAVTEKELSALMPSVLDRAFKGEL